jgi:hypothetical protein
MNIQYWITNKQAKQTDGEEGQTTDIGETTLRPDVAVSLLLLVGVWVVQVVVLLDIFGEQ